MYIFKNAFKSIRRSKARNILIGIIALVIAVSSCIALSIRQSAAKTKEDTLAGLEITAQISYDRSAMMSQMKDSQSGIFDKDSAAKAFSGNTSLSLDELEKYSKADSVKNFYYTLNSSLDAGEGIEPVDSTGSSDTDGSSSSGSTNSAQSGMQAPGGGMGGKGGFMGTQGDFTVTGYSSDAAMTDFISGICSVTDGEMVDASSNASECVISDELATYNSLKTGDTIKLVNPNNEDETVILKIIGIYNNSQSTVSDSEQMGGFSTATDSANKIIMSYNALKVITDKSAANATETTDEATGRTTSTAIRDQLSGTYVFENSDKYEAFEGEVRDMGLDDSYTVSSADISSFESSIQPLENLSKIATYFLIVVFAIGAVILIVLNIFNIRERKYEIGVLTAIGMKKPKVAMQFVFELFVVMVAAIIIGAGIGAATSVPVTNALLESQIESNNSSAEKIQGNFGRDTDMAPGGMNGTPGNISGGSDNSNNDTASKSGVFGGLSKDAANYISKVSYSTDLTVVLELISAGLLLTLISSLAAVLFIMRYEPLKILSNRE